MEREAFCYECNNQFNCTTPGVKYLYFTPGHELKHTWPSCLKPQGYLWLVVLPDWCSSLQTSVGSPGEKNHKSTLPLIRRIGLYLKFLFVSRVN